MIVAQAPALLAARVLIATIFVMSGVTKITGYAGTQQYMEAAGVPGALLPLVVLVEAGGGLLVALGLFTRPAALALAGFTLAAGLLFHLDVADGTQTIQLMKNLAIAGGFLALAAAGPGAWSLDARRQPVLAPAHA